MLDSGGVGVFKRGLTFKEMTAAALLLPFTVVQQHHSRRNLL